MAFNGGGFAYAHLLTPKKDMGMFTPLRDLWASNMSLLAQHYDISESKGKLTPQMGDRKA